MPCCYFQLPIDIRNDVLIKYNIGTTKMDEHLQSTLELFFSIATSRFEDEAHATAGALLAKFQLAFDCVRQPIGLLSRNSKEHKDDMDRSDAGFLSGGYWNDCAATT